MRNGLFQMREFTGYHMAAAMALFFGTVISVNVALAWFANASWTGLVVKNSYVESQRFNRQTGKLLAQAAMGLKAEIAIRNGAPIVILTEKAGARVSGATVELTLGRPSHMRDDMTLALSETATGAYASPTAIGAGAWIGDIHAILGDGRLWQKPVRLMIRGADR